MLEAANVSFAYQGKQPVLRDVSLSVAPGDRVALVAPSGFGKSTLCKVLAGYLQPACGRVLLDGQALPKKGISPVQLIWQHPEQVLDPRMRMERQLTEAGPVHEMDALVEKLGIRDAWMKRYPHELSGGELQRFCIARALASNPRYLICDEISTMLDAVTQAQLWAFLLEEAEARSLGMVLVTHSEALRAKLATRAVALV